MNDGDGDSSLAIVPALALAAAVAVLTAFLLWPAAEEPKPPPRPGPAASPPGPPPDPLLEARARVRAALAAAPPALPALADVAVLASQAALPDLDRLVAKAPDFYELEPLERLRARYPGIPALETLRDLAALAAGDLALADEAERTLLAQGPREGLAGELRTDLDQVHELVRWLARSTEYEAVPDSEVARVTAVASAREAVARLASRPPFAGTRALRTVTRSLAPTMREVARAVALRLPAGEFQGRVLVMVLAPARADALSPELAIARGLVRVNDFEPLPWQQQRPAIFDSARLAARNASEVERAGQDLPLAAAGYALAALRDGMGLSFSNGTPELADREELVRWASAARRLSPTAVASEDRAWMLALEHDVERKRSTLEVQWATMAGENAAGRAHLEEAMADMRRALACVDRAAGPLNNRRSGDSHDAINILLELGRAAEAQELVTPLEPLDPMRADVARLRGDADAAVALASQRLARSDEESSLITEAHAIRALALLDKGDLDGARGDLDALRTRDATSLFPRLRPERIAARIKEEAARRAGGR